MIQEKLITPSRRVWQFYKIFLQFSIIQNGLNYLKSFQWNLTEFLGFNCTIFYHYCFYLPKNFFNISCTLGILVPPPINITSLISGWKTIIFNKSSARVFLFLNFISFFIQWQQERIISSKYKCTNISFYILIFSSDLMKLKVKQYKFNVLWE